METLHADALTPVTVSEVYASLRASWRRLLGGEPQRCSLLVLLAQWAFETGRGRAMHCWNVGNIKHVPGDGRDFCQFRASEIVAGVETLSVMSFRAYADLDAGCADYLTVLRAEFRYAWPAVEGGDPADFAHRLKLAHYYTADEAIYSRGLVALVAALDREIGPDTSPDLPTVAEAGIVESLNETIPDRDPPPSAA